MTTHIKNIIKRFEKLLKRNSFYCVLSLVITYRHKILFWAGLSKKLNTLILKDLHKKVKIFVSNFFSDEVIIFKWRLALF